MPLRLSLSQRKKSRSSITLSVTAETEAQNLEPFSCTSLNLRALAAISPECPILHQAIPSSGEGCGALPISSSAPKSEKRKVVGNRKRSRRRTHDAHLAPSLYLALLIPPLSANPHTADSRSVGRLPFTVAHANPSQKSRRQSPESSPPEHRFCTDSRSKFASDHSAACRFEGSSPSLPEQNPQRIRVASSVSADGRHAGRHQHRKFCAARRQQHHRAPCSPTSKISSAERRFRAGFVSADAQIQERNRSPRRQ